MVLHVADFNITNDASVTVCFLNNKFVLHKIIRTFEFYTNQRFVIKNWNP